MIRYVDLAVVTCCLGLAGCSQASLMKRFTPAADEAIARKYVDLLRQEQFEQIKRDLDPSLVDPNVQAMLTQMAALFPPGDPKSVKVVGANVFRDSELSRTNITLEYEFPSKWLLVNITSQRKEGSFTIVGFHVNPISDSLETINKFTLTDKSPGQYFILVLAILVIAFSFYVFVLCLRTKNLGKKWLWAIFILIGLGKLVINWTTGDLGYQIVAFQIPCASATAPFYGPWTVAVSFPLGAILFLLRRVESTRLTEAKMNRPLSPGAQASSGSHPDATV